MEIKENISLKPYNTFGIDVSAKYFAEVTSVKQLIELLKLKKDTQKFVLGGGSNLLFTKDLNTLVIYIQLKGISVVEELDDAVIVEVSAGENWHKFVLWAIEKGYGGVENLSLIPGNVGTAPIQNIGAYGVEIKDVFVSCNALSIETQEQKTFSLEECAFGYRDSVFKKSLKGKYIITSVRFKLTKKQHQLNTSYGAIEDHLSKQDIKNPSLKDISNAVIAIRSSKLPNPDTLGNSGSFFKNPVISSAQFESLTQKHPKIPFYKVDAHNIKIPAGWLIEQCGFKGKRFNDAGVHSKQALVLVNYGNASGNDIWQLSKKIQQKVYDTFGINIIPEVNII